MASETQRIARLLQKTFDKQPWYGTSLIGILNTIPAAIVDTKIGQTHSIHELALHMVAWLTFATNRLNGDNVFQITPQTNFPVPSTTWSDTLHKLNESQTILINALTDFPEEKLGHICPSNEHKYTYYTLLHRIIHHDIYHLGQIALLQKALTT